MTVEEELTPAEALAQLQSILAAVESDPLEWISWLPLQHAWLSDPAPIKLLRAGNQIGKTTAGLAEVHFQCLGVHPLRELPPRAPGVFEAWIICASWSQSLAIQEKFWAIAKRYLREGTSFDPINGFHANKPTAVYRNGSRVRFKTASQDALDLSGATIHLVLFDEPPRAEVFSEVAQRVKRTQGQLLLTLTPINRPTDWLREMVDNGQIVEHHSRLTPDALIPLGESEPLRLADGTPMDGRWIADAERLCLPMERAVRIHGEWETRTEQRVFDAFDPALHVREIRTLPEGEWHMVLGIDHGTKEFKQTAILAAVCPPVEDGDPYRVIVLDEDVGAMKRNQRGDAIAILEMLDRNGLTWKQLDEAWGDRIHLGGTADKKANRDLMRHVARQVRIDERSLKPQIYTVKRGAGRNSGSVKAGCRWLYQLMAEPGCFAVSPRCAHLIDALERWQFADDDHKDKIDALRYALQSHIFRRQAILAGAARRRAVRLY